MFTAYPNITCIKIRNGDKRTVKVKEGIITHSKHRYIILILSLLIFFLIGDPKDHHVVIVDDLVMTGGTLIQCAKVSGQK
jgi:adenine/guanine phosphoribosyltransferase-like PRPP-binding protein